MRKLLATCLVLTLSGCGAAPGMMAALRAPGQFAGAARAPMLRPDDVKKLFDKLDTNKDGSVSLDEAQAAAKDPRQSALDKLDANKDGKISADEFKNAQADKAQKLFDQLDKNKDGSLGSDELGRPHWFGPGSPGSDAFGKPGWFAPRGPKGPMPFMGRR